MALQQSDQRDRSRWHACEGLYGAFLTGDSAGTVSKSADGLAQMMTVLVTVFFEAPGLTVSENNKEAMLLRAPAEKKTIAPPLVIEEAGQRYISTRLSSYTDMALTT